MGNVSLNSRSLNWSFDCNTDQTKLRKLTSTFIGSGLIAALDNSAAIFIRLFISLFTSRCNRRPKSLIFALLIHFQVERKRVPVLEISYLEHSWTTWKNNISIKWPTSINGTVGNDIIDDVTDGSGEIRICKFLK